MNAPEAQHDELRVPLASPVPAPFKPAWLIAMEEADRLQALYATDAADLLLSLQRSDAVGVSLALDDRTPAGRVEVLHILVARLRDAQEWSRAKTPEGLLAAAVHLHLNT